MNSKSETEDQRGNIVAKHVWSWLKEQQSICYVPWVLDPNSPSFDPQKAAAQNQRDDLLADLESVILTASRKETP